VKTVLHLLHVMSLNPSNGMINVEYILWEYNIPDASSIMSSVK